MTAVYDFAIHDLLDLVLTTRVNNHPRGEKEMQKPMA